MTGRILSKETREKIGNANRKRIISEETRRKISASLKGKNKGRNPSLETREKMSISAKNRPQISIETRRKLSEANKGEKSYRWKGGITPINQKIRNSIEYKLWRSEVYKRDNYTCVICKNKESGNLNADHIKPFAYFPELRLELSNGRTLCIPCHRKTNTYGSKKYAS